MQENFELRIREFQKLKKGWNFGEGETFSKEHVEIAALIATRYHKRYNLTVSGTPCVEGSIELAFNKNDKFLDVRITPDIKNTLVRWSKGIGKNKIEGQWQPMPISKLDEVFSQFNNE